MDTQGRIRSMSIRTPIRTPIKIIFSFLLIPLLLLNSCGFHLRGLEKIPENISHINLQTNIPAPYLWPILQDDLRNNGAILESQNNLNQAQAILTIQAFKTSTQLINLTGVAGAGLYQLTSTVTFVLMDPDNKILLGPVTLSSERQYSTNSMQVLSDQSIEARLTRQIAHDLSNQIIHHLATYHAA